MYNKMIDHTSCFLNSGQDRKQTENQLEGCWPKSGKQAVLAGSGHKKVARGGPKITCRTTSHTPAIVINS